MDNEFIRQMEIQLDDLRSKVKALEDAVMQIPRIKYQSDPSRPAGVVVEPEGL